MNIGRGRSNRVAENSWSPSTSLRACPELD
jgi:hypothetical protein